MATKASRAPAVRHQLCLRFHAAVELIGRRWNGAIIFVLLQERARFCELREAVVGVTDRMLTERLQELEREGVVARMVVPETPVRVEYELTKKGRALAHSINAVASWAQKWVEGGTGAASDVSSQTRRTRRRRG